MYCIDPGQFWAGTWTAAADWMVSTATAFWANSGATATAIAEIWF